MKAVVLGGTGSLGQAVIKKLLSDAKWQEVVCVSRCELKQKTLAKDLGHPKKLRFVVGDLRDPDGLARPLSGAHTVFHFAALKHVDVLEDNPEESVKTNVIGTMGVANVAEQLGVPYVVFSSTDKAVDPINVYGMCKGISERILFRRNELQTGTRYSVFRWGNVLASRGSVIPDFISSLKKDRTIYLTHDSMSRFWIPIEEAAQFLLERYETAPAGLPCIPKIKACPVRVLAQEIASEMGITDYDVKIVGVRSGEKIHESLSSQWSHNPISSNTPHVQMKLSEIRELVREIIKGAA